MRSILINWIVIAIAVFAAAWVVPGVQIAGGLVNLAVIAAIFGLINAILGPIIKLLTLPLIILTLGLFALIVNTGLFMLTAAISPALSVDGIWPAFLASVVVSIVTAVLGLFVGE